MPSLIIHSVKSGRIESPHVCGCYMPNMVYACTPLLEGLYCVDTWHPCSGAMACFTMVRDRTLWMPWFRMHKPSSYNMLPCLLMIHHHNKDYCHLMAACSIFDTEPPRKHLQQVQQQAGDTCTKLCLCATELSLYFACKHNAKRLPGEIMAYQVRWHLFGSQRKGLQPCRAGVVEPPLQSATAIGIASAPA